MRARPELVGGDGADDTALMRALPGWIAKRGAEGLLCAVSPDGRGYAFKVADGNGRALRPALAAVLGVEALAHVPCETAATSSSAQSSSSSADSGGEDVLAAERDQRLVGLSSAAVPSLNSATARLEGLRERGVLLRDRPDRLRGSTAPCVVGACGARARAKAARRAVGRSARLLDKVGRRLQSISVSSVFVSARFSGFSPCDECVLGLRCLEITSWSARSARSRS